MISWNEHKGGAQRYYVYAGCLGAGSTPSKLLLQAGKDGKVYILNRSNLGGFGSQLYSATASTSVIIDVPSV